MKWLWLFDLFICGVGICLALRILLLCLFCGKRGGS